MPSLAEYFPWYVWLTVFALAGVAVVPFFLSSTLQGVLGLSVGEYIFVMATVEFAAAAGIGALVVRYRNTDATHEDTDEWRFDP